MAINGSAGWHDRLPTDLHLKVRKLTRHGYVRDGAGVVERTVCDYRIAITNRHDRPRSYRCEITMRRPERGLFAVRAEEFLIGPVGSWSSGEALVSVPDEEWILTPCLETLSVVDETGKTVSSTDLQLSLPTLRPVVRNIKDNFVAAQGLALVLIALVCGFVWWWSVSYF